jgi:hypothetical protein
MYPQALGVMVVPSEEVEYTKKQHLYQDEEEEEVKLLKERKEKLVVKILMLKI